MVIFDQVSTVPMSSEQIAAFARDLSDLCRKHGIGILDEPTLFVLEEDDFLYDYTVGSDDRLRRG